jgi:hypothetical protein
MKLEPLAKSKVGTKPQPQYKIIQKENIYIYLKTHKIGTPPEDGG